MSYVYSLLHDKKVSNEELEWQETLLSMFSFTKIEIAGCIILEEIWLIHAGFMLIGLGVRVLGTHYPSSLIVDSIHACSMSLLLSIPHLLYPSWPLFEFISTLVQPGHSEPD